MNALLPRIISALLFTCTCASAFAELRLPPQFSDGMVLQRGIENFIWGACSGSEPVWYKFESDEKTITDHVTPKQKAWRLSLPLDSNAAGFGRGGKLTIWQGKKGAPVVDSIVINDVVVGDVWIVAIPEGEGMPWVPAKNANPVRLFSTPSLNVVSDASAQSPARWVVSPPKLQLFSYEFGRAMFALENVPIAIIETTPDVIAGELRNGGARNGNRELAGPVKRYVAETNQRIGTTNALIMQLRVQMKHRGLVAKMTSDSAEIQGDDTVIIAPASFSYRKYSEFEPIPSADNDPLRRYLNFKGIVRPGAGQKSAK